MEHRHSRLLSVIGIADLPLVGGKNASVGAMYRKLTPKSIQVANGFAVTAEACRRRLASLFTDRTIHHRIVHGFEHFKVALSTGIKKIMRSDLAANYVMFALDTESVPRDVVFITMGLSPAALLPATLHVLQVGKRRGRKPRAPR